jgi:hypothetical protein
MEDSDLLPIKPEDEMWDGGTCNWNFGTSVTLGDMIGEGSRRSNPIFLDDDGLMCIPAHKESTSRTRGRRGARNQYKQGNMTEAINSDEERCRLKRASEFSKATATKAKKARRNTNPPEDWKDTVMRNAPDNIRIAPSDILRRDMPVRFIDKAGEMGVVVLADGTVSVPDVLPMPKEVPKKKDEKPHKVYEGYVPLSIQRSHLPNPVVLDEDTTRRIEEIEKSVAEGDSRPFPVVHELMAVTSMEDTPLKLARNLKHNSDPKKDDYIRGIVAPESANIYSMGMDRVLSQKLTAPYSQMLAQSVLQDNRCRREEANFIMNRIKQTHTYNWEVDGLGLTDEYYANMKFISRKVAETMNREPFPYERPCAAGMDCVGNFIPRAEPVTLVEFYSTDDINAYHSTGKWSGPPKHCFMCMIKDAGEAASRIMAECAAYSSEMVRAKMTSESLTGASKKTLMLVNFYNRVGEGEFSPYDVFVSNLTHFSGIASPVLIFVYDRFKQRKDDNGMRYYDFDYPCVERNLDDWEAVVSKELSQTTRLRQLYECSEDTVIDFVPRQ